MLIMVADQLSLDAGQEEVRSNRDITGKEAVASAYNGRTSLLPRRSGEGDGVWGFVVGGLGCGGRMEIFGGTKDTTSLY